MTNSKIRTWYRERVAEIAKLNQEWIALGIVLEERALRAWRIRHDARIEARSMMESAAEIEDLRERDRRLYGNPDGPTFDQLLEENRRGGFQDAEAYERIISGAQLTNREVNLRFDKKGPTG